MKSLQQLHVVFQVSLDPFFSFLHLLPALPQKSDLSVLHQWSFCALLFSKRRELGREEKTPLVLSCKIALC